MKKLHKGGNMKINSKQISFRKLKLEDFNVVLNWNQDERFCKANDWPENRDNDELFQWWNWWKLLQYKLCLKE